MKKVYIAGKFAKDLTADFRSVLLGYNIDGIPEKPLKIGRYNYIGPFFKESASIDHSVESTHCRETVAAEMIEISKADLILAYLPNLSTGSLAELVFAASKKKDIIIYCSKAIEKECWFTFAMLQELTNCKINLITDFIIKDIKKLLK